LIFCERKMVLGVQPPVVPGTEFAEGGEGNGVVILTGAVPVALPVMFTVSVAFGSEELARHGVLGARLSAAQDVTTMDVLCVDKTGTIMMNQLAVTGVTPLKHATQADALVAGALASQERSWFWAALPSKTFISALNAEAIMGTVLTLVGLKGLAPLTEWRVPNAASRQPAIAPAAPKGGI
jgi:hypothetical protein